MRLELTAPSKTFLLGEYLALLGGPTLLLNTEPRFKLIVKDAASSADHPRYRNIDKNCPAAKFIADNPEVFNHLNLIFHDPYKGLGGFGASAAQYCLVAAIKNYLLNRELHINELLEEYQSYAWDGIHYKPSGADVVAQIRGGITYFNRNENILKKFAWPFPQLAFCLIHSGNKMPTHTHLSRLGKIDASCLEPIVMSGVTALAEHNADEFCKAIDAYGECLLKKELVCDTTLKLLNLLKANQSVLAAKGCGALGADVICVLLPNEKKAEFQIWAENLGLNITFLDNHTSDGIAIKPIIADKRTKQVITVDANDQQIGTSEKILAHQKGLLHRAFSVFIFRIRNNKLEVLLQKRANNKYHCAGLWTNTCCSHPAPGEDTLKAANHRLQQEMGLDCQLFEVGAFRYRADVGNGLVEHEIDHVFIGHYNAEVVHPDPQEVADYRWVTIEELLISIAQQPMLYTPWLQQALTLIVEQDAIQSYLGLTASK